MRNVIVLLTSFAFVAMPLSSTLTSQTDPSKNASPQAFYFYNGKPKSLELNSSLIAVRYSSMVTQQRMMLAAKQVGVPVTRTESIGIGNWFLLTLEEPSTGVADVDTKIRRLLSVPEISFASPVFHGNEGCWIAVTDEVLVQVKQRHAARAREIFDELASELVVSRENFGNMEGAYVLHSDDNNGFAVLASANRLALDPRIAWAEPNALFSGRSELVPNDPGFTNLWGIHNTGQYSGVPDQDMDGDQAWDTTTGNPNIKILIIDTGVQQDHPDINQLPGYDVTGEGGGGGPVNACDNHGTAVAGCVSAIINNAVGTVGIAPSCRSLSVRTFISNLSCNGSWSTGVSWTVDALTWGESQGARVSNNSNYYGFTSSAIEAKYQSSRDNGMIHFASAGNNGSSTLSYPASLPTVNAVAALSPTGARASFSQYGVGLDFSAPGVNVYSTDRTGTAGYYSGDYGLVNGTSFASPYTAGVAALILSRNSSLNAAEVETRLQTSSRDIGAPGYETDYGWGFVNALSAVRHALLGYEVSVLNQSAVSGNAFQFDVVIRNTGSPTWRLANTTLELTFNSSAFSAHSIAYVGSSTQLDAGYTVSPTIDTTRIQIQVTAPATFASSSEISSGGTRIGTFRVTTISNPSALMDLAWRVPLSSYQSVGERISNERTNLVTPLGIFLAPPNTPLPISLASFTARMIPGRGVHLQWMTISEINNYGFYVQKKLNGNSAFLDIPNSFVAGHGTTNEPQHYEYTDSTAIVGSLLYRLRQVDLDGTEHLTEPIHVSRATDVGDHDAAPKQFSLGQNYPNPFNPVTVIKYVLPKNAFVTLSLFNTLGQRVQVMVDNLQQAGYHETTLDASSLASGVYLYRIEAGEFVQTRKLVLLR